MSDPVFLRNFMSGTIYAEQVNSAQIQGQAAARERATRARQEALKDERTMIEGLEDAARLDLDEREGRGGPAYDGFTYGENGDAPEGREDEKTHTRGEEAIHRIDFTI
jgi:hypothetical protein